MNRRDRKRKQDQRHAHAKRTDDRKPAGYDGPTANERRNAERDARREVRHGAA